MNIQLPDSEAVRGKHSGFQDLIVQVLNDGYEPFSTAGLGNGIVVSFKKLTPEGTPARFDSSDIAGYL